MKKIGMLTINICLLFLLAGCWDRTEINDNAFVVASGIDKGEKNDLRVSLQIPLPSSMGGAGSSGGGGGTSGGGPFVVEQGTGGDARQGLEDIQNRLSRRIYFAHRRVVIVGEELAKQGIYDVLNEVFIQPQSRISTFLLIAKGDAVQLLQTQPKMEQFSGEALREMAKANINMTVKDAIQDLDKNGKEMIVPVIEPTGTIKKDKNGKEVAMESFAVFKSDKLSFMTNKKESKGVFWITQSMHQKNLTFTVSKKKQISVQIIDNHIKPKFKNINGKPTFVLSVRTTGTLLENEPNLRIEDPETYHFIITKMKDEIKSEIKTLLDHSHSRGVDVYGFGLYLNRHHHQQWKNSWEKDWKTTLKTLNVSINVDADIQRTTNSGLIQKELKKWELR